MSDNLFLILNQIMYFKEKFNAFTNKKNYDSFMINRWLGNEEAYVLVANEMNKNSLLPKDMQYDFLKCILPKKRCKLEYTKEENNNIEEEIKIISYYYDVNLKRAFDYYNRLSKEQFEVIKRKVDKGIKKYNTKNKIWY
jgi:hypothetical protein